MHKHEETLLALLAATIDHDISRCSYLFPLTEAEWDKLLLLAGSQGVTGLVFSAVEHLPREVMPPMDQLMDLLGQAEYQKTLYQLQFDTAQKFAKALKIKGVEMKVLKGISFSTYYDQPELRECGDCDCYLSIAEGLSGLSSSRSLREDEPLNGLNTLNSLNSKSKAGSTGFEIGNQTIEEIGGKGEFGSYKHSHLFLDNLMFENHHYITDFNGTKQGKVIELLLEKAIDSAPGTPIPNSDLVRPCAHFCALHLLRHAQGNLMLGGMTLRMIYDWAVFLRSEQNHLDWNSLINDLSECRLLSFAEVMNELVRRYFGLIITNKDIQLCADVSLIEEIILDTMRSQDHPVSGESLWHKSCRIYRRFQRMYRLRKLATESVPMMIWNSIAFSSYMKREIEL